MLRSHFATAKHPTKWGFGCEIGSFYTSQPFRSCKKRLTMLQNGTRVPKVGFAVVKYPAKWSFGYEIGIFHVLGLRSRFAAAKWGSLCCEMALVCQKWFRSKMAIPQRSGDSAMNLLGLQNCFAAKCRFHKGCEILQTPVFPLFLHFSCSKRLSFISFAIPPDFDHPKTYITSKQTRIKALKSKLKQVKKKQKDMD